MKVLEQTGKMRVVRKFFLLPRVIEGRFVWFRSMYVRQIESQGLFGTRWISLCEERF